MEQNRDYNNHTSLTIEAICEETGISRSTVYQYLRMGLLHRPVKIAPKQLRYNRSHIERLQKIRVLKEEKKLPLSKIKDGLGPIAPGETDSDTSMDDLRLQTINVAAKIFSKKGFSNTTIGDITDAMKIGKGTFYGYFKSKEDLFLESIRRLPEMITPKHLMDEIDSEKDFFQRTRKRGRIMMETFPTFISISNIAKIGIGGNDKALANKARAGFKALTGPLVREIRQAMEEGLIRELDAEAVGFFLYGLGESMGYWLQMHPEYSITDVVDIALDLFWKGMLSRQPNRRQDAATAEVRTKKGVIMRLTQIRFDDTTSFKGRVGGGELQIDSNMISVIHIHGKGKEPQATVTMNTGENVILDVSDNMLLSGESSLGQFRILLCEVETLTFDPEVEEKKSEYKTAKRCRGMVSKNDDRNRDSVHGNKK
ncbi:MAG: TetR family transcriptional regulator [Pseudomonadota bacterium]